MLITEFYEKYKLSAQSFSEVAHVGTRTLRKYERGEWIRAETRKRIELAMYVAIKHDLVRPVCDCRPGDASGYMRHHRTILEYNKTFETLLEKEKTLA